MDRTSTQIRDASYRTITEDRPHIGRDVLVTDDAGNWSPRAGVHAGKLGVIKSVYNAGFRGIIAQVEMDEGDDLGRTIEISTGALLLA